MRKAPGSLWFALATLALVASVGGVAIASDQAKLPACATEGSDNCHWDATHQGNGRGRSFDIRNGIISYTH